MHAQTLLYGAIAALSTATALPKGGAVNYLQRRAECTEGHWCSPCIAEGNCGNMAVDVIFKPDNLEIGNIDLANITDAISEQCYGSDISECKPSDYKLDTVLENGDDATLTINFNSNGYETWAQNLMVDAFRAALEGAVKRNTVTGNGPMGGSQVVSTIPSSVTIRMFDKPEYSIVLGIAVEVNPSDGVCADVLGVGAAVAGAVPHPAGAGVSAVLSIASVFCD